MTSNLGTESGDPAERFDVHPDLKEFYREIEAARFRMEQQQAPEGGASQDEIYKVACAFLVILIVVIILAIWFSVTAQPGAW